MDFKVNVNQHVKVKLTDYGIEVLKERHDILNKMIHERGGKGLGEFELRLDENGYYRTQLWLLMKTFGQSMDGRQPFEIDIIIENGW